MSRVIFENADGTVGIIVPAPNSDLSIQEIARKDVPEGLSYAIIEDAEVPSDRSYRNEWVRDASAAPSAVGVRMGVARDASLVRLRARRDELLEVLDKEYTIAARTGASVVDLDAKRASLLAATDAVKALDVNNDGIVSVEEAATAILPLELAEL